MCMYVCMYVCMYIYIYIERERDLSLSLYIYIYTHIYVYTHTRMLLLLFLQTGAEMYQAECKKVKYNALRYGDAANIMHKDYESDMSISHATHVLLMGAPPPSGRETQRPDRAKLAPAYILSPYCYY